MKEVVQKGVWIGTQRRQVAAVGAALLLAGMAMSAGSVLGLPRTLDGYPGFSRTPEGAVRDDTIAFWEAFQREQLRQTCMADDGFDYFALVAFPEEATIQVAE